MCWFLSLLAGSHLTGTCYNYLKPYSLFIPHFVRVVCRLALSVCIRCCLKWQPLLSRVFQPLNAHLDQPASGKAATLNTCPTGGFGHLSDFLYIARVVVENIVLPFQIIANHCHSSTKNAVLKKKNVILNEHYTT